MHLFTGHRTSAWRFFANFNLPTHPLCWLRGHRARAEVQEPGYNMDPWILVYCRTCGIRHSDPYMGRSLGLYKESTEEAKEAIARQVEAARTNNASYARVRDGRDDYGHHKLELALEIPRHKVPYGSGIHLHLGDRWSETPLDGTLHLFRWSVFFSVGGVGNRLAHWLTKGKKRDIYLGGKYRAGLD